MSTNWPMLVIHPLLHFSLSARLPARLPDCILSRGECLFGTPNKYLNVFIAIECLVIVVIRGVDKKKRVLAFVACLRASAHFRIAHLLTRTQVLIVGRRQHKLPHGETRIGFLSFLLLAPLLIPLKTARSKERVDRRWQQILEGPATNEIPLFDLREKQARQEKLHTQ